MPELTADDLVERSQWSFFWVPQDAVVVDRPELLYSYDARGFFNFYWITVKSRLY